MKLLYKQSTTTLAILYTIVETPNSAQASALHKSSTLSQTAVLVPSMDAPNWLNVDSDSGSYNSTFGSIWIQTRTNNSLTPDTCPTIPPSTRSVSKHNGFCVLYHPVSSLFSSTLPVSYLLTGLGFPCTAYTVLHLYFALQFMLL